MDAKKKKNQEFSLWTFSETETEDESSRSYTRKVIQAENNPDRIEDGRLMMSDSNRASRDWFFWGFFLSTITDTARKTLVV